MSSPNSDPKGIRLLPIWFPIIVVVVTAIGNFGSVIASYGNRLSESEHLLESNEKEGASLRLDYFQFKSDMRSDISAIRNDLTWIRRALENKTSENRERTYPR